MAFCLQRGSADSSPLEVSVCLADHLTSPWARGEARIEWSGLGWGGVEFSGIEWNGMG